MKLLWLSHLLPWPPKGGVLQRSYHLLRQAARHHDVHLLALNQPALLPGPEDVEAATRALSDVCASVEALPIPSQSSRARRIWTLAGSLLRRSPYDVAWLRSRDMAARARELAAHGGIDLVHADTLGLIGYTAPFRDTPVVLNHHNVESHMMARRADHERSTLGRAYLRREAEKLRALERRAAAAAATNLVVSELDRERLLGIVPSARVHVVDNGVDTEYFRPQRPPGEAAEGLVFAGGLSWYPNRDAMEFFLREIWPRLLEDHPQTRATIIGRNPFPELVEAARDPRLEVPGFVDDVRPYLESAAVYLCPIRTGGGTRLKILDALAMAKPLVATAFAVEGLGLVDGEHYLRADDAEQTVAQVRRLREDPALRAKLAEAGRRHVEERYAWDVVGEKLESAYREALAS